MTEDLDLEAFLRTLSGIELASMPHEARAVGDHATITAVLAELKRRVSPAPPVTR